jgi:glycosyltransferase involved in cell wall biosynthesis
MKILVVSPTPTHPTTAGNRARILSLTDLLRADGHAVHFAYVPFEAASAEAMRAWFGAGRFHALPYRPPRTMTSVPVRVRRKMLRLAGRETGHLWRLDDWYDDSLQGELAALHAAHAFDCVFVEYVFMSKALDAFPAALLKVLDTHDRFALRHRAYLAAGRPPQWFSTTADEEAAGLARADVVLAIQDEEAGAFRRQLVGAATRVVTVGHLLDLRRRVAPAAGPAAVFLASDNPINVDAARFFMSEVLPRVRAARPGFTLVLAGDVCDRVPDGPGVRKLGRVDAVEDAFARGAVAVNPVRLGTGINVKLLESLAAGLPTVCSRSGARGIDRPGDGMLVVPDRDPAAMARAVGSVLADPALADRLAAGGRRMAEAWHARQVESLRAVLRGSERPA